jgi:hypothetical protein
MHWFTVQNHRFPDPADPEDWLMAALWPSKLDPTTNISYDMQAKELKGLLDALGFVFSKLTHIWRVGGARKLDEAGVEDNVSAGAGAGSLLL